MMTDSQHPVRVLHITNRLSIGGPTIYVTLLSEGFIRRGYEVSVVCGRSLPGEGDMGYYAAQHGIEPIVMPQLGGIITPVRDVVALWRLYRYIREYQPDVVHTHTTKAGFIGRLAAWMARTPVIVHTFHSHVFEGYFNRVITQVFIQLERLAARMSDAVLTLTEGLRQELSETYHIMRRGRIIVLPIGLDLAQFSSNPRKGGRFRAAWHIPDDAPLIGTVGRLDPIKNHKLFLRAAALVLQQIPEARFAIVGDGGLRDSLEQEARDLGITESVVFTGWQQDLPAIYSDFDVSVVSSINEGMPVSVIEALAAGCPVVATAVGGVPDLLNGGEYGRLVPSEDDSALAQAIVDTLRSPPDMTAAQRTIVESYGMERLVSDVDSLYRGLLAKKRHG